MLAQFYSLEWKKGEPKYVWLKESEKKPSSLEKIVKRKDGNVCYVVPVKNQYIITVRAENGKFYQEDVYGIIKYFSENVRITKNFRIRFEAYMSKVTYSVNEHGFIYGLYKLVEDFLNVWLKLKKKRCQNLFFRF